MDIRVGIGYDVHKLVENRKLILGGVQIEYEKGLLGHSDADVLLHAIMDSMTGAAKKGDIGRLFPDNSDEFKDIDSMVLLKRVYELLKADGWKIGNIDAVIVAQRPKLMSFIPEMEKNIAKCLEVDVDRINVKATTEEKLGFTGSGEGMSAKAVCLIQKD